MKRGAILLIGLVLVILALGEDSLPYSRDIEDLELMRVMGIDAGETAEGRLKVTMASGEQSGGADGKSSPPVILHQEEATLAKACAVMESHGEKFIFYGHVTQCLVGEAAAQRDLVQLLDYYERDTDLRLNASLFVIRGGTAGQTLTEGGGESGTVVKRLESIEIDAQYKSDSSIRSVKDVLAQLSENGCALVPALVLQDEAGGGGEGGTGAGGSQTGEQESGQSGESQSGGTSGQGDAQPEQSKTIRTAGYAVFCQNQLTGFLEEDEAKGANFLMDEIYGGILEVDLADGSRVAVELVDSHCEWVPSFDKAGTLTALRGTLTVEGAVSEIIGGADPLHRATLAEMETLTGEQVRQMAAAALTRSQTEGADFFHLKRKLGVLRPDRWHQLQVDWDALFPELDAQIEVTMHLRRTYDVNQPLEGGSA